MSQKINTLIGCNEEAIKSTPSFGGSLPRLVAKSETLFKKRHLLKFVTLSELEKSGLLVLMLKYSRVFAQAV